MATNRKTAKTQAELSHEQLARADLVLRQTSEKVTALFAKVHAVQVEVQELRAEQRKVAKLMLTLLQQNLHFDERELFRVEEGRTLTDHPK